MFLETEQKQATFGYAPTFLQRTNVSEAYGDDDQDWWLTMSQRDWSLGEGQRNFSASDDDTRRRYWVGSAVDISLPGTVRLQLAPITFTFANSIVATGRQGSTTFIGMSSARIYSVTTAGTVTDEAAHSLGVSPSPLAMVNDVDGRLRYSAATASNAVKNWNGTVVTDFSTTQEADALAYLNNALYGVDEAQLWRYDTAGAATSLFTWKAADGSSAAVTTVKLLPYGGDLLMLLRFGSGGSSPYELWLYDGVAPARIAVFPHGFSATDMAIVGGAVFIAGSVQSSTKARAAVMVYSGGNLLTLWTASDYSTALTANYCAELLGGLAFTDSDNRRVLWWDPSTGAISELFSSSNRRYAYLVSGSAKMMGVDGTNGVIFPGSSYPSSGTITTSLFDGETTRSKRFKGVVVEWVAASDGNGGSVDISYRLNDLDGSFTSLQTSAVSGTEYAIGQTGRAISIRVTLNKGTSTSGPVVKRIYVRAAPVLDSFRRTQYVLNLTGRDGEAPLALRDGTLEASDGLTLATSLQTAIQSTTAISITDELGTYTAFLEPEECEIVRVRPNEYVAVVRARQV